MIAGITAGASAVGAPADPMDDEFPGSTLDAKWAWFNQLTSTAQATAVVSGGNVVVSSGAAAPSPKVQAIEQSYSGAVGRWRASIPSRSAPNNFNVVGLGLRDSGSGKIQVFGFHHNGAGNRMIVINFSNDASYAASPLEIASPSLPRFLEIEIDATNIYFRDSPDDTTYTLRHTATRAGWLTTPDRIGFQVTTFGGANAASITADWFHRLA